MRGDAARCRELGVRAYLPKPVVAGELAQALQHPGVQVRRAGGAVQEAVRRVELVRVLGGDARGDALGLIERELSVEVGPGGELTGCRVADALFAREDGKDAVGLYLDGIAKTALLNAAEEVELAKQIEREATRFGYEARVIRDQSDAKDGINICNYDRLEKLDPDEFGAIVLDGAVTMDFGNQLRTSFPSVNTGTGASAAFLHLGAGDGQSLLDDDELELLLELPDEPKLEEPLLAPELVELPELVEVELVDEDRNCSPE